MTARRPRAAAGLVAAALVLAALTLLLPSTPTYDPWAWIIWGREIAALDLVTDGGPSWKPLPVLFTTPFSLAGDAAPALWLVVARAGALLALAAAYRLGVRLAGPVAGVAAAVVLALSPWHYENAALGNSEGLLVAAALWAVERHLAGDRRAALLLATAAALLRPEAWPFLGLYALWLWTREPPRRALVVACLAAVPLLWCGPELWGSGDAFRAADRAQEPEPHSPAFAERPALEVVRLATKLWTVPVKAGIAAALLLLLIRPPAAERRRAALWLAAGATAWIAIVAAMTEGGFAGNSRYLLLPAAIGSILAPAGLVWLARSLPLGRLPRPASAPAASALAAVVLGAALAAPHARQLPDRLEGLEYQAQLRTDLRAIVERGGGRERLLACAPVYTGAYHVQIVAWELQVHANEIGVDPLGPPAVVLRAAATRSRNPTPFRPRMPDPPLRHGPWQLYTGCRPG